MTWKITYRDSNGKNAIKYIEAESRHDVFGILSNLKINAIKVEGHEIIRPQHRSTNFSLKKSFAIISFIIVLLALCLSSFLYTEDDSKNEKVPNKKTAQVIDDINNVKSQEIATNQIQIDTTKKERPTKVGERVGDYIKLPSGRIHHIKGERTNTNSRVKQDWFRVFKSRTDNDIALILTLEPGETLVGTLVYRGGFKKTFLESLNEPISINENDSIEIKELKKAVAEARKELKAAYERGEDIDQIIFDSRNQFQDLATYRQQLESEVRLAFRDVQTEEEFDELISAANKMLEEKGIAPSSLNAISKLKLKLMMKQQKGKK